MVEYATKNGLIRNFGDIEILSIQNGIAELRQELLTIDAGGSMEEDTRFAITPIDPRESEEQLFNRLNEYCNIIITPNGSLASLKAVV